MRLGSVRFEEDHNCRLADSPAGNTDHKLVELILVCVDFDSVHIEERKARRYCRSFVSIEEWVIAADAIEICRRHLEDGLVKKTALKSGLDIPHCRSKESGVTESRRTTEETDLLFMNAENFVESKKQELHYSLRRRNRPAYF